jgi:isopenicillin N synthase-like dioxygenase
MVDYRHSIRWYGLILVQVPQNEILLPDSFDPLCCLELVHSKRDLVAQYMQDCQLICGTILERLSESLGLEKDQSLQEAHKVQHSSASNLSLLKYLTYKPGETKVGHYAHTDVGTLTLLHSNLIGLQIFEPESSQWHFIKPLGGHLVTNVGDSLTYLSRGILKSSLHRVVPHKSTEDLDRYTIAYFMRPNEETRFTTPDGKTLLSKEWSRKKFEAFAAPLPKPEERSIMTGLKDFTGAWDSNTYESAVA